MQEKKWEREKTGRRLVGREMEKNHIKKGKEGDRKRFFEKKTKKNHEKYEKRWERKADG